VISIPNIKLAGVSWTGESQGNFGADHYARPKRPQARGTSSVPVGIDRDWRIQLAYRQDRGRL